MGKVWRCQVQTHRTQICCIIHISNKHTHKKKFQKLKISVLILTLCISLFSFYKYCSWWDHVIWTEKYRPCATQRLKVKTGCSRFSIIFTIFFHYGSLSALHFLMPAWQPAMKCVSLFPHTFQNTRLYSFIHRSTLYQGLLQVHFELE